jgi:hypothetical protein
MDVRADSAMNLPYSADVSASKAFDIIAEYKARAAQV